jgi:hypothetical protein
VLVLLMLTLLLQVVVFCLPLHQGVHPAHSRPFAVCFASSDTTKCSSFRSI